MQTAYNVMKTWGNNKDKTKLNTISEEESMDKDEEMNELLKAKDIEINGLKDMNNKLLNELKELKNKNNTLKQKNREINIKNNSLEKDVKNLKQKLKKLGKDYKKMAKDNFIEQNKKTAEKDTLNQLYLNSNRIKEFMDSIKKYGEQYQTLKKRQLNLTKGIG